PSDIKNLVKQQQHLLETLWSILKSGGKLLYATCSILPEENDEQISHFIAQHDDVIVIPLSGSWGTIQQYGKQIFSGVANMDGFYYSLLEKRQLM
ncbi:MAG TPA: 16S rRNA (cytosine(967)-C(5))-methyltransferase, partial [Thiothrix sp.]|nr:16S rRNA (cytosine(967)-C(5))-methyltransferase [Thiothrix sp.]